MPGKIYLVSLNGVPKYVGFTVRSLGDRWKEHVHDARSKRKCYALQKAINKHGPESFTISELYSAENEDHTLNVMEPHFIREYKTHVDTGGYNLTYGGDKGWLGKKHKEESKEKIRLAHLGKKRKKYTRRPPTEETRQKIRLAKLGRKTKPCSEETKEKIRQAYFNRRLTASQNNPSHPIRSSYTSTQDTQSSSHAPAP